MLQCHIYRLYAQNWKKITSTEGEPIDHKIQYIDKTFFSCSVGTDTDEIDTSQNKSVVMSNKVITKKYHLIAMMDKLKPKVCHKSDYSVIDF